MSRKSLCVLLVAGMLVGACLPVWAQGHSRSLKKPKIVGKGSREFPPFDKVVAGMQEIKGFFTLYRKKEKLYALIKPSQYKKPFYLAMTLTGGLFAGMQWDAMLVYWNRLDRQLLLVRPEVRHRAPRTTMADVVKRTFPSTIIRAVPILALSKSGAALIDLGRIFKSNLAGVAWLGNFFVGGGSCLNPRLSKWTKVKVFPQNVELGVQLALTGRASFFSQPVNWTDYLDAQRSYRLGLHFSLAYLPRSKYKPRKADTRIGYFCTAIKDFSQKYNAPTNFVRYIHRWHLEKVDPSLKLSPPKKPIIFYIEKTVPYRYRRYVREGILEWNKAFEKIGFSDAIVVRQQTDKEFADLDPEDVRYNFFRWTTHDLGFAAGPSRVNPLTGEIIDADIIFDDSMLRYAHQEQATMLTAGMIMETYQKYQQVLQQMPPWNPFKDFLENACRQIPKLKTFGQIMHYLGHKRCPLCLFGQGMRHQMILAQMVMAAKGWPTLPEEFIGEVIKQLVMHEVGHTLGLFHNFKGSSWLPLTKINSPAKPAATSGSVMDYNPTNFVIKGQPAGHYLPQTLGPYDYWAIAYGYTVAKGTSAEAKILKKITDRVAEQGLAYGNDFYASLLDPDPQLVRFDFGDDPVAYARQRMQLVRELCKDLIERMVKQGEDFYTVRRALQHLLFEYGYSSLLAARSIGGIYLYWDHKGDPQARNPLVVVPATKQREALQFLLKTIFADKDYQFEPELLSHLAPGVWWHWGSDETSFLAGFDLHRQILMWQDLTLYILLNPLNLKRLYNNPMRVAAKLPCFTMADLFTGLTNGIWSELQPPAKSAKAPKYDARHPFISSIRRNLQRRYLYIWINYLVKYGRRLPGDTRSLAWQNLSDLLTKIEQVLKQSTTLDTASCAHLTEARDRIRKLLKGGQHNQQGGQAPVKSSG